jgi:WD40 repeat protein
MKGTFMSEAIAFSRDGQTVASGGMVDHIQLWSVKTGQEVGILSGISNIYRTYALSPNGKKLASGSSSRFVAPRVTNDYAEGDERGNTIKLWDMSTGELIQTLMGHAAPVSRIIFSDDGKYLATAASTELKIWDAVTGRELRTLKGDQYGLEPMTFDGSGGRIVTKSGDQIIKLWEVATGRELLRTKSGNGGTATVAADADGRRIAIRDGEKNIKILSVESGRVTKTLKGHQEWVSSLAFAHGGDILASASQDKTVKLWDVRKGVELFTLSGHKGGVGAVVFSKDDKVLLSGAGNEVKFWDPASGKELRTLTADCGGVHTLRFDHDGRTMTCAGSRTDIKILDLATGKELATVVAVDRQDWITVTPEGLFDSSHNAWNYLNWRFSKSLHDVAPAEAFFSEFYYPGLLGEIFDGRPPEAPFEIGKKDRRQPQLQLTLINAPADSGAAITARMIKVRVEVTEAPADGVHTAGSGVRDVRLFRNGSLVKVWRGAWGEQDGCELQPRPTAQRARRTTCTATIPIIAGENRLTAYAFNSDNVKSLDGELITTGAESLKRMGTLYVLNVGVGKYENPQYDLSYAADDALAFGEEVKLQQERVKRFQRVEVLPLLNQEATKARIIAVLRKLSDVVQPEDGVMMYFSGHGTAQGDRFYLIPHDMSYMGLRNVVGAAGVQTILAHSISDRELEEVFRGIDAGHLLLVIDACNSGKALQADDWRRGPMNTRGLAQLAYEKGMYILTASQSYELAFESKALKHGYLTYALIEGLKTRAADADQSGDVLLREWFDYAMSRVPNLRQEQMGQQTQRRGKDLVEIEEKGSVQQPRVFYRRESDVRPFVIARPTSVP